MPFFLSPAFLYFLLLRTSRIAALSTSTDDTFEPSANHHYPESEWPERSPGAHGPEVVAAVSQQSVVWGLKQWGRTRQGHNCSTAVVVHVEGEINFFLPLHHCCRVNEAIFIVEIIISSFFMSYVDAKAAVEIVHMPPPHMVLLYSWSCVLYWFHGTSHLPRRPHGTPSHTHIPSLVFKNSCVNSFGILSRVTVEELRITNTHSTYCNICQI